MIQNLFFRQAVGRCLVDNLAVLQDQDSGAVLQHFGQVIGDDDHAHTVFTGQLLQNGVDIVLGTDVNTHGRTVEDQNVGIGCQPLCQNDTLLVTTGQGIGIVVGVGSCDCQIHLSTISWRTL